MQYNDFGKFMEEAFGVTEFWVYSTKNLEEYFNKESNLQGKRIVKTSANLWLAVE